MEAHEARERLLAGLPVTERRIDLAGVSTAVLEGGEGPPVVLLHGPGEFAAIWLRVIPELALTHRVIAPDLPGHGTSEVTGSELDADRTLAWLAELIEHTCPSPPVLVGKLVGGAIAARYAAGHGHTIDRLVLADSLGIGKFRPTPGFAFALVRHQVRPTEGSMAGLFNQCMADPDRVREQLGERWEPIGTLALNGARDAGQKTALKALMSKVGVPAIPEDQLKRIAVPTALIHGRENRAVRLRVAEEASRRYGWPLEVIEGAGDDAPVEQPAAFLRALRTALGRDALQAVAS